MTTRIDQRRDKAREIFIQELLLNPALSPGKLVEAIASHLNFSAQTIYKDLGSLVKLKKEIKNGLHYKSYQYQSIFNGQPASSVSN